MSFPNGGMPSLTMVAHDHLHRLAQGSAARGFGLLPDFLVASILAAENLLLPFVDPAISAASTVIAALNFVFGGSGRKQRGQSDLQFLAEIADSYDADFWVDGDVLYLSRFMKEYAPRMTLAWGQSLLDFSPRISTVGQVAGVSMKFTLREIPLDFLVTVFWDFDRETLGVSVMPGVAAAAGLPFSGPALTDHRPADRLAGRHHHERAADLQRAAATAEQPADRLRLGDRRPGDPRRVRWCGWRAWAPTSAATTG